MNERAILEKIMQFLQGKLRYSLAAQGHTDTGRLGKSITFTVERAGDTTIGKMYFDDYGIFVNVGVRAENVRYPIRVLIEWWQRKGLQGREAIRAAYATRAVHRREGIPSRGSYKFSATGQRTKFVEAAITPNLDEITDQLERQFGEILELRFGEIFDDKVIRIQI